MEDMLGGIATVTTDYKGPPPAGVSYEYQNGHAADGTTHAAYDISCDTGSCWNTPLQSPVAGRVVCAGYGQGTGEALGSPQCTYSQNTTTFNDDGTDPAHTIVIEVGVDPQGNPIQLSFNHMGTSNLKPGDTVQVGDLIGGMGNGACSSGPCPHVHLEGWLGDPQLGYQIVDPTLIVDGYYSGGITPA
jgi:murein DD-endopeptidase MepM/ murein hydrolase activator NlpD